MPKISIIGAGNVGSQAAFYSALRGLGDIVLVDVVDGLAAGKALDMLESMPIAGVNSKIIGGSDYALTRDSDIVVVTAGIARKPGMSRHDLIETNSRIMRSVIPEIGKESPESILIVVTNPLDEMVHLAHTLSGFPKQRVLGMAGVLDSVRFRTFIAEELGADVNDVKAMVLGSHGDLMIPLVEYCTVKGEKISNLLSQEKIDVIVERVRKGGVEIVKLLKTGSAFFAPGLSIAAMVEAIIKDQKNIMPCSVLLQGEYGVEDVFIGVPVKLGRNGAEEIIELELNKEERLAFDKSVSQVKTQ
ncbi:MAG: malate dehydrogenase [Deltaproteobacteria bacterium]|nr:malate dehydrogenase [Deltaproteobacteria bacterium]